MLKEQLQKELTEAGNKNRAELLATFFKTGPGKYGHGDVFLGIYVPTTRAISKKYPALSLSDLEDLLKSKIHEVRLAAILILIDKYACAEDGQKMALVDFYVRQEGVNNWDLVDVSAARILGNYLLDEHKGILYELVKSQSVWKRRIAIVATHAFIKCGQYEDTLRLAELLCGDTHDLIHKAVGWMLREVGKKNQAVLEDFLEKNCAKLPRTTLRYAIEKFSAKERKAYLKQK